MPRKKPAGPMYFPFRLKVADPETGYRIAEAVIAGIIAAEAGRPIECNPYPRIYRRAYIQFRRGYLFARPESAFTDEVDR